MPKTTDITGTVRIPEEHMGRFWNFMRSMPACEFTPIVEAKGKATVRSNGKTALGTTGKCLCLSLFPKGDETHTLEKITDALVEMGKARSSVPNIVYELKKVKHLKGNSKGYTITPAGLKFKTANCDKAN